MLKSLDSSWHFILEFCAHNYICIVAMLSYQLCIFRWSIFIANLCGCGYFDGGLWEGWLCHSLGSFPGGRLPCLQVSALRAASQSSPCTCTCSCAGAGWLPWQPEAGLTLPPNHTVRRDCGLDRILLIYSKGKLVVYR